MAHEISVPRLGWSMEEGIFIRWLKRDGDFVRRGEALFELEGEKRFKKLNRSMMEFYGFLPMLQKKEALCRLDNSWDTWQPKANRFPIQR